MENIFFVLGGSYNNGTGIRNYYPIQNKKNKMKKSTKYDRSSVLNSNN